MPSYQARRRWSGSRWRTQRVALDTGDAPRTRCHDPTVSTCTVALPVADDVAPPHPTDGPEQGQVHDDEGRQRGLPPHQSEQQRHRQPEGVGDPEHPVGVARAGGHQGADPHPGGAGHQRGQGGGDEQRAGDGRDDEEGAGDGDERRDLDREHGVGDPAGPVLADRDGPGAAPGPPVGLGVDHLVVDDPAEADDRRPHHAGRPRRPPRRRPGRGGGRRRRPGRTRSAPGGPARCRRPARGRPAPSTARGGCEYT